MPTIGHLKTKKIVKNALADKNKGVWCAVVLHRLLLLTTLAKNQILFLFLSPRPVVFLNYRLLNGRKCAHILNTTSLIDTPSSSTVRRISTANLSSL